MMTFNVECLNYTMIFKSGTQRRQSLQDFTENYILLFIDINYRCKQYIVTHN